MCLGKSTSSLLDPRYSLTSAEQRNLASCVWRVRKMRRLCDRSECRLSSRTNNVCDARYILPIGTDIEVQAIPVSQLEIWHRVYEGEMLVSKVIN